MLTAVFFDLYNTLAGFSPSRFEIQSAACADFGIRVTPEGIRKGYGLADAFMAQQNAIQPLRELDRQGQKQLFTNYEKLVLKDSGTDITDEEIWNIWLRIRQMRYELARYDDVLPAMDLLKSQGLVLGMITNINRDACELVSSLGLAPYLDFTVTSTEVGVEKPHAPIFLAALSKAESQPHEVVHVGDQLMSDVEGAKGVGINPVLLDRDGNYEDVRDCPRIKSLMELPSLVSLY